MFIASSYALSWRWWLRRNSNSTGCAHVCKNIRRIAGVKSVERMIMNYLREEVETEACIVGKLVNGTIR